MPYKELSAVLLTNNESPYTFYEDSGLVKKSIKGRNLAKSDEGKRNPKRKDQTRIERVTYRTAAGCSTSELLVLSGDVICV